MPLAPKLPLILLASLIVAVAAYGVANRVQPAPEVHFSYLVRSSQRQATTDFEFDGFFALQATDLFTSTLAEWITTPEVVVAAFDAARLERKTTDPRALSQLIKARKTAPQLVEVTVMSPTLAQAERLAEGLRQAMAYNLELYHQKGISAVSFEIVATVPFGGQRRIAANVVAVAAFVVSFILFVNAVLLMPGGQNLAKTKVVP